MHKSVIGWVAYGHMAAVDKHSCYAYKLFWLAEELGWCRQDGLVAATPSRKECLLKYLLKFPRCI